ncbi:MAG TPA: sigma-70 family RNA polymerase sigma factor [Nocardioides sp.]|uniref:RNA polymerase sigma factor n=1 Tax=uncultured Nocardioides sp. TaxID=198441 RepID=UPI00261C0E2E|nr:sigma-70 family RNA polymerase sigma factor [uncultured Nocardioides sp.]HRD62943.1 sigma-70 family RNA polymerase sigma factor [Nocardioides sp.]HRI96107.1 sigma-70 family RNA polymerase sigma factor [Nocardioides sp.]HRK45994.1 sigma-70 family RNA polymerase sigma factor [Nocardioides sp.]
MYQARTPALITVVTFPSRSSSEARVTIGGAATERPGEVWGQAASAFQRWAAGDAVALDELVRLMTPVLWHVARAYRLPSEVAEDVVQNTWLALVRSRERIQEPAAVGGWLTTTTRREAWKVAKASGRGIPVDDDELARRLPDEGSAEAEVVRRDSDGRLWNAVELLSERCQALLRIVAFEHRPDYREIAADLGMPVGSIGPTRGRCLQKLRALIEEDDAEENGEDHG